MGVPEVKEDFKWCPHCVYSKKSGATPAQQGGKGGCTIYADRPQRCRDFSCQWLKDMRFGDHWFPAHAKIVVDHVIDEHDKVFVIFVVDPTTPTCWQQEPWFSDIMRITRAGLIGFSGVKWTTVILVRDVRLVIGK